MNRFRLSSQQKQRIADAMPLREGVSQKRVLNQIEKACHIFMVEYYDNESVWKTLDSQLRWTPWRKRGRVKKRAMVNLLTALVLIYRDATGLWIGRKSWARYDKNAAFNSTKDKQKEHPPKFIVACLAAIHRRYSPRLLQNVLHKRSDRVIYIDDDVNVDWLHPNAKQFLARQKG